MNQKDDHDDDIQTESLTDLSLTGAQAEETKAGSYPGSAGGVRVGAVDR